MPCALACVCLDSIKGGNARERARGDIVSHHLTKLDTRSSSLSETRSFVRPSNDDGKLGAFPIQLGPTMTFFRFFGHPLNGISEISF